MTPPTILPTAHKIEMESLTIAEYVVQKELRRSHFFTLANVAVLLNLFIRNGVFALRQCELLFLKMFGGRTDSQLQR